MRFSVVAIYDRTNGIGDIVLPRGLALAHATAALDNAVFVAGGRDPEAARGLDEIARAVPTAVVRSMARTSMTWNVALMIGISVMAAFHTGAMAAAERRRELVLARLGGATRAQVAATFTLESLVTTLTGIGIGAAVVFASLARPRFRRRRAARARASRDRRRPGRRGCRR